MKQSRFTEEQILRALQQAGGGMKAADVCRDLGIATTTLYAWKKRYKHMDIAELRHLRQLEAENSKLKRTVNELKTDCSILQDIIRKKI